MPEGIIGEANIGLTADFDHADAEDTSVKAIFDFGMLDVDKSDLDAPDGDMTFVGITSDMLVVDLGTNRTKDGEPKYRLGDVVKFKPSYMAVARLLNSKFIDRRFV